ncbi:MAG: orotate phosphoribosyltransferase [bacterium]|nr:orotate phosphoribosyltransferase [bacterium]
MLEKEKSRLLKILKDKALKKVAAELSSGRKSHYYIDGKLVTLDPEGAFLVAKIIIELLKKDNVDGIGGLTIGADPIVSAVAAISYKEGFPIPAFIVRNSPKKHGMMKLIEGPIKEGSRVVIVDDVVTTGGSIEKAISEVEKASCKVIKVIAIVDRLEGAKERFAEKGYNFISIFTREDLGL